jgi:monoamine oxidase
MTASARLTGFAVSRWGDDPWSLGSWSLIGRYGTPQDRAALGMPVGGRLRIAGEATHPTRAGMTHGAYEQGVAAAVWAADLGHSRVAVVGAGMAGLAAARTLGERGVCAPIWEARDRAGGRTAGVEVGGTVFDLGANWLQQYDENVLARLAETLGLRTVATDFDDPLVLGDDSPAGTDEGRAALGAGAIGAGAIEAELRARLAAAPVGAGVAEVVDDWLRAPGPWDPAAVRRLVDAEIVMDSGAPLSWLSARHGFEPGVGEGDRWIAGGYRLLVEHLADGLDVRLGHPVRWIHVDGNGVTLTGDGGTLRADAVIVTAPLGVLAAEGIAFEPPLPATHRDALSRLGMGRVEKVVLRFDRRFWPEHAAGYFRVHGTGENCVSEWLDATGADGRPTMVGLFAGPWLDEIWAGPEAVVAGRAAAVLVDAASGRHRRAS